MTSKHTAGPATVDRDDGEHGEIYYALHGKDYDFVANFEKKADADLCVEAFNVATETGMTPRELADSRAEYLERAKELDAALLKADDAIVKGRNGRAELLAALEGVLHLCGPELGRIKGVNSQARNAAERKAIAAIAKATGGA